MILLLLIPVSLTMGLAGFAAFLWALRNDQFSDLDGAAWRVVLQHQAQDRARQAGQDAKAFLHERIDCYRQPARAGGLRIKLPALGQ